MRRPGSRASSIATLSALLLCGLSAPLPALAETPFEAYQHHIDRGEITQARRALESELVLRPENIIARYNLALLLQDIGDDKAASALYTENLARQWHLPSLVNLVYLLRKEQRLDDARAWLKKGTRYLRHESAPWYLLAEISEPDGRIKQTGNELEQATRADPLNGYAWIRRAAFLGRHGHLKQALRYADRATRLLPACAPCWSSYGDLLLQAKQTADALDAYQHALAIEPDADTRTKAAQCIKRLKR